ncbi:MAG TPA: hypothetical protein VJ757_15370 [Pseudonocardiaceae bacterium]|nr:hypothetical protein [Pseudonocardiaceae bacterium]
MLQSADHQILYGRRGTGKTHALHYLGDCVERCGDLAVYVDLRTVGSTGGLYVDSSLDVTHRGTVDTIEAIHEQLLTVALEEEVADQAALLRGLDAMADAATAVEVVGEVERETTVEGSVESTRGGGVTASSGSLSAHLSASQRMTGSTRGRLRRMGVERHYVMFGPLTRALRDVVGALGGSRLWLLLDEWSSVPLDLQPLLADLIRRAVLPVPFCTVKIAAIERRSRFWLPGDDGGYVGIEVGADAATAINLDDFMIFNNAPAKAQEFFRQLFYNHACTRLPPDVRKRLSSSATFVQSAFKKNAFDELVRAAEGVPRDSINIAALAAQYAHDRSIDVDDVRRAARDWYLRDKQAAISANEPAHRLLRLLVNEVVGRRRARTFLLDKFAVAGHEVVYDLYEARLLHVLRRGIVDRANPGTQYDGFAIDYGCYVALLLDDADFEFKGGWYELWLKAPKDLAPDNFSVERSVLDLDGLTGS